MQKGRRARGPAELEGSEDRRRVKHMSNLVRKKGTERGERVRATTRKLDFKNGEVMGNDSAQRVVRRINRK